MDLSFLGLVQQMPPANYQQYNAYNAMFSPSTVHCSNTELVYFFTNYLLQDVFSIFKFRIPDTVEMSYFNPVLFMNGFITFFRTDKFGIIGQMCSLYGYNVYYQPTHTIVNNPLIRDGIKYLKIGRDCALVRLQYNYRGLYDIVTFFADLLALCAESMGINVLNTRLAYVFPTDNKAKAETVKEMFDRIAAGNPSIVIDKKLTMDGDRWEPVFNNIKQNYIAGDIAELMRTVKSMFLSMVGIPNANTGKKERLIKAEVESNDIETASLPDIWQEQLEKDFNMCNMLFGGDYFGVERRFMDNGRTDISRGGIRMAK